MNEAEDTHNTDEPQPDDVIIIEPAPGVSIEDAHVDLARLGVLAAHFNQLNDELEEAHAAAGTPLLTKCAIQLGMFIRYYENSTFHRDKRHAPLLALFAALMDRIEGGEPALLFDVPRPEGVKTKPNIHFRDIGRAYLAAAADVLMAAGMKFSAVIAWWDNDAEAKHALRWRAEISAGTAPPLISHVFHELRPVLRQPVELPQAERQAREWRAVVELRDVDV